MMFSVTFVKQLLCLHRLLGGEAYSSQAVWPWLCMSVCTCVCQWISFSLLYLLIASMYFSETHHSEGMLIDGLPSTLV